MTFRVLCGFIFIPFLSQIVHTQTITMEAFLEQVKQNHPFFVKEEMQAEIEEKTRERFLGEQDWIVTSSPLLFHQKSVSSGAFDPSRVDQLSIGASAQRAYWNTGGRLALSWSSLVFDQSTSDIVIPNVATIPAGPSTFYQNGIFATYSHPLMQNKGGKLDRLEYELGTYNVGFAKLQALENQEDFLLDMANRFLSWALLSEQIQIAKERLNLAEEQLEQTAKMREANLVDQVDVIRAEDAIRITKQNIVLMEAQWKGKQAELAVFAQSQEIYNQGSEFDLYKLETLPSPDEAAAQLRKQSRLLQAIAVQKEKLSYHKEGFVELTRPQLFLNASAGLQQGDDGIGGALILDKPEFSISVNYRYPLGNRTSRTDVETMDLRIRQLSEDIKSVELSLEATARNLLIQIKEIEKVLALNREQIESAKQKTEEELKLYNQGRGQLTFVIQSRDNEENAKLVYAQNAKLYHELILKYRALLDELIPSNSKGEG